MFIVQIAMSIMFKDSASDYLQREYASIEKYDSVFYDLGCRSYSPFGVAASPEYRFATQVVTPIVMIAITFLATRYTPVPPMLVNMATGWAASYFGAPEVTSDYRTLIDDEDADENDEESDSDEDSDSDIGETTNTPAAEGRSRDGRSSRAAAPKRERRGPSVRLPDIESEIPEGVGFATGLQSAIPTLVNMVTSLRPPVDGAPPPAPADAGSMMNSFLKIVGAFTGAGDSGAAPAAKPVKAQPRPMANVGSVPASPSSPQVPTEPAFFDS